MSSVNTRKALISGAESFLTANETISTASGAISGLPVIDAGSIAWENVKFSVGAKDPWASVFYKPNTPEGRTVGQRGYDEINGFIQIDFNTAMDKGEGALLAWEEKARIFFHAGRVLSYGGQNVLVISAGMSEGRQIDNFYRKSLTVAFRGHLKRVEVL